LFEVMLYLSLMLDAVSVAFQDRTPDAGVTSSTITIATAMTGLLILLLLYFVWLAARKRKNWPRWVLAAACCFRSDRFGRPLARSVSNSIAASKSCPACLPRRGSISPSLEMLRTGSTREYQSFRGARVASEPGISRFRVRC